MVERVVTVIVPAVAIAALAWSSGGYFARTWGAVLLVEAIALATVAILARRVELGRGAIAVVGALLALAAWQLISRSWAVDPDIAVLEAERTLMYAGAAAVGLLTVFGRRAADLVTGVLVGAGTATLGGLCEYVLGGGAPPDRLDAPVGYTNASGILATTTLLLGVGLAADGPFARRALGAALAPPAMAALYLSLSRGSLIVATLGVLAFCATTRSGTALARTVLVGLPTLVAGSLAAVWELDAPGRSGGELAAAGALGILSATAVALAATSPRLPTLPVPRRGALAVVGVVLVIASIAVAYVGVREVRHRASTPAAVQQQDAEARLLSTSTSSRSEYWAVAGSMVAEEPVVGEGAGSFTRTWLRERPALLYVRDAHNLYLETLGEVGIVGFAALLVALLAPLAAAPRAVRDPVARAALVAYAVLLVHAVVDWDWELPAITFCTLLLGVALLRSTPERTVPLRASGRVAIGAAAAALGAVAIAVHAGNGATAEANDALDRGDAATARSEAARAERFLPWAAEPWQLRGEADLAAGRVARGRLYLRRATREDPGSWSAWLSLALATDGPERAQALERARGLNPLAPEVDAAARIVQNP